MEGREAGNTVEEEALAEAYSDMTFADVDNHHELGFSAHEDKNVTCQSKAELLSRAGEKQTMEGSVWLTGAPSWALIVLPLCWWCPRPDF